MGALEAALALIGLVVVILFAVSALTRRAPRLPDDLATPYREGLHAAVRMQVIAQDLEQQMYAEAIRRADQGQAGQP